MKEWTKRIIPRWQYSIIFLLGISVGVLSLLDNPERNDMVGTLIRPHLSVLLPQSLLLVFMMWQVLTYKSISALVEIRHQAELIQTRLLLLVGTEITLYFIGYYGVFAFSGIKPFIDGSPLIGSLILALRYFMMLILGILVVGAYRLQRSGLLMILTLLISMGYHYWFEMNYLLIMYSPLYDPIYRAMHHIYGR